MREKQVKLHKLENYMKAAEVAAENSHDEETKVGCVIVGEDGEVILHSYNGFIPGAPDHALPKTRPGKYKYIQHSERNAISQAARRGIALKGCMAVCTLSPCSDCLRALWSCGIRTVVFRDKYKDFNENMQMRDMRVNLLTYKDFTIMKLEEV